MEIYTIGFGRKSAREFFEILKENEIQHLVDVRLRNTTQLAGFTKKHDLEYFLDEIAGIAYTHMPDLSPTDELLDGYRKGNISWPGYEEIFFDILESRKIEELLPQDMFKQRTVLLCSEPTADQCHRRLIVEYLQRHWEGVEAVHL